MGERGKGKMVQEQITGFFNSLGGEKKHAEMSSKAQNKYVSRCAHRDT